MKTNENKELEYLKRLADGYLNTLKPTNDKTGYYTAEIKVLNYSELGCVIANMLKLCVLALNQDECKISETVKPSAIDVGIVLEVALQLFPNDEFDLLSEINEVLISSKIETVNE
ncbi:hypothetical protein [Flavobacterium collinsii]|uniref:Uncharacterized protein n=1 Tax=Flavobacterium collinsii TaxID=1114861 RepID=A0A9W4TJ65_9FLAO|nr:hypothetical protein [Flavobacterium collinsii]CAI2766943.1 conserved protein of unknown function [Flavobacterium collinsii]